MNKLDNYGCAGGVRCKAPDAPHGRSLQAFGNAAARPASTARMFKLFMNSPLIVNRVVGFFYALDFQADFIR